MGRLIDGAIQPMLLANYILERKDTFVKVFEKGDNDFLFVMLMDYFDSQPTAYDPDKVVEQLENERKFWEEARNLQIGDAKVRSYAHAIQIVKGGGVDAN